MKIALLDDKGNIVESIDIGNKSSTPIWNEAQEVVYRYEKFPGIDR